MGKVERGTTAISLPIPGRVKILEAGNDEKA